MPGRSSRKSGTSTISWFRRRGSAADPRLLLFDSYLPDSLCTIMHHPESIRTLKSIMDIILACTTCAIFSPVATVPRDGARDHKPPASTKAEQLTTLLRAKPSKDGDAELRD